MRTYLTDSVDEVKLCYRFLRNSIQFITNTLAADLERPSRRNHALNPQEQVLVNLCFFAIGSFLEVVGDTVGGIPKRSVFKITSRVSTAVVQKQHKFIRCPSTAAERQEIKQGFPRVVSGCIDETHIRTQGPSAQAVSYTHLTLPTKLEV